MFRWRTALWLLIAFTLALSADVAAAAAPSSTATTQSADYDYFTSQLFTTSAHDNHHVAAGARPAACAADTGPALARPRFVVVAADSAAPLIKAGSEGGETAGKAFSQRVRQEVLDENPSACVYSRMETDRPQVDHVIPRSRGGNATFENGQTTCWWCNASKGARDFPVNPPPGFEGMWPPGWWWLP